jgi:hypothetical protein
MRLIRKLIRALAKRPVHGPFAMRVLSDIVKRRSFRANVAAAGQDVLCTPNDMFDSGHNPPANVAHVHVSEV